LVDTSVWVDHLRRADECLSNLLEQGQVAMHPFVVGEIACGSLADRSVIELLLELPSATVADDEEVLQFIEGRSLHGNGIGFVDVHLLASAALGHGMKLWTRDKRLRAAAQRLGFEHTAADPH
jgi:predicted nucleic acid-binding protein